MFVRRMFVRLVNPLRLSWRQEHSTMSEGSVIPGPMEISIRKKVRPFVDRRWKGVTTDTSELS